MDCCFQWFKDTNLKANHNHGVPQAAVDKRCFQWFKDTNLKANHNTSPAGDPGRMVVSNGSKILI